MLAPQMTGAQSQFVKLSCPAPENEQTATSIHSQSIMPRRAQSSHDILISEDFSGMSDGTMDEPDGKLLASYYSNT